MDGALGVQRVQSAPSQPVRSVKPHRTGSRSSSEGLSLSDRRQHYAGRKVDAAILCGSFRDSAGAAPERW